MEWRKKEDENQSTVNPEIQAGTEMYWEFFLEVPLFK